MIAGHTKGTVIIEVVRLLRTQPERSKSLLSPDLHHYLAERVFPSGWYPEVDLLRLLQTGIDLLGLPFEQAVDLMGAGTADEHYKRYYGERKADPDMRTILMRTSSLWSAQHDTGRHEFLVDGTTSGRFTIRGFAHPSRELCGIIGPYSRSFLKLAGWGDVTVEKASCRVKGDDHCAWHLTWTRPLPAELVRA